MPSAQTKERTREQAGFTWEEILRDPNLRDLPYKIETNEHGQIVMSPPPSPPHGFRQPRIARLLEDLLPEGHVATEMPVRTAKGTKGVDACWFSAERRAEAVRESQSIIAPEICVEILSPSNTEDEMLEKKALYFEAGAEEVWLCDEDGRMRFFGPDGEREQSARAPSFPQHVEA
jgi:Uma2 family endonuclease